MAEIEKIIEIKTCSEHGKPFALVAYTCDECPLCKSMKELTDAQIELVFWTKGGGKYEQ